MGMKIESAWSLGICLSLVIAFAQCVPVEYVYTGEGCECPTKLGYQINVPRTPCEKKYTPSEYGYKLDVPVPAKAKVTYSFDFTVEEPKTPKPEKPCKWDLYAKVDRVTVNKKDCEDSYAPAPPSACSCGQCGVTKPLYRYVYKKVSPCKCRRPNCRCNSKRDFPSNSIDGVAEAAAMSRLAKPQKGTRSHSIRRRKRDLQRAFFRTDRRKQSMDRPGRFVKLYNTNLPEKSTALFAPFQTASIAKPLTNKTKRKAKKILFPLLQSRIVKRDIKGEYDLIEKEREQMDLTLPEIIQYMPETLQSDFKRGPCYFGCSRCPAAQINSDFQDAKDGKDFDENNAASNGNEQTAKNLEDLEDEHKNEALDDDQKEYPSEQNNIATAYTKRNAADYDYNYGIPARPAASAAPFHYAAHTLPSYADHSAYSAEFPTPSFPTNPNLAAQTEPQNAYSAPQLTTACAYDRMAQTYLGDDNNHNTNNDDNSRLRFIEATFSLPDHARANADSEAHEYAAGDREAPTTAGYESTPPYSHSHSLSSQSAPIVGAQNYPVQGISNADLDRILADIIYRHPDFIDATSHYGGGLVDPEPWQEHDTKDFLKRLIDGRLNMWFGHPYHITTFSGRGRPKNPYSSHMPSLY